MPWEAKVLQLLSKWRTCGDPKRDLKTSTACLLSVRFHFVAVAAVQARSWRGRGYLRGQSCTCPRHGAGTSGREVACVVKLILFFCESFALWVSLWGKPVGVNPAGHLTCILKGKGSRPTRSVSSCTSFSKKPALLVSWTRL